MDSSNLELVEKRIALACEHAGRARDSVLLLPVSKTQSVEAIQSLYDFGLRDFGENRVQELLKKRDALPEDIRWHFIGHLQSNKAKYIAPFVHAVHSVHNVEVAHELSKRATQSERIIKVLIEVNISDEEQKQGIAPKNIETLAIEISNSCPNLLLSGLMGMASFEENIERTRPQFRTLRELRNEIQERHAELTGFTELSMGMSNDFEIAIEEGATIIRIGSALFGER